MQRKKTKTTIQDGLPIGARVCPDMTGRENGHATFYSICYRILSFLCFPFRITRLRNCFVYTPASLRLFPSPAKHCGQRWAVNSVCSLFYWAGHTRNTKGKSPGPVSDTRGKNCDNRDYTAVLAGIRTPRRIDTQSHVKSAPTLAGGPNVNNLIRIQSNRPPWRYIFRRSDVVFGRPTREFQDSKQNLFEPPLAC